MNYTTYAKHDACTIYKTKEKAWNPKPTPPNFETCIVPNAIFRVKITLKQIEQSISVKKTYLEASNAIPKTFLDAKN